MSRKANRLLTVPAAVVSAAVLSACGTGLEAQTYKPSGRFDGASTTLQTVAVRNVYVQPPKVGSTIQASGQAVVLGVIVNPSNTADALIGASSDVAANAVLQDDGKPVTSVPLPGGGASASTWSIALSGLTRTLHVGEYISVTLVFENAERTTLQVPVRAGENGLETRPHARDPYGVH